MLVDDPHFVEQCLERRDASTWATVENGAVISQHRGRITPGGGRIFKRVHHVGNASDPEHTGGDDHPGVIVDEVEDLDLRIVFQPPMGDISLPTLVGQCRFETDERVVGTLVRLGVDEPPAGQDAPDRRDRRDLCTALGEMPVDGASSGVEPLISQMLAQDDDFVLDLTRSSVRSRVGSSRSGGERLIATCPVAGQFHRDPALGHSVAPGHLSDASALEHHRVDHVPSQLHRSHPSPRVSTMTRDMASTMT